MDTMNLLLLLLFSLSVACLIYGLWIGYQDLRRVPPDEAAGAAPLDEELLIFDRVTLGLSQLPRIDEPRALQAAQAEVMQNVGTEYGLTPTEVETIYWRIYRWKHGTQQ
ncbi:MAG: hypothetical protein ACE5IQ_05445 [Candidatus Methylomirabilales bacterium]